VYVGSKQGLGEGEYGDKSFGKETGMMSKGYKYITRTGTEIEVETGKSGLGPSLRTGNGLEEASDVRDTEYAHLEYKNRGG